MTGPLLWITERYPPAKGGMAVSCARQVRGLRRRMNVDVLDTGAGADSCRERDNGVDYHLLRDSAEGLASQRAWSLVRERHARESYRLVVGFGASWAGYLAATFAAWLGIPHVVLVRGNDFDRDWFLPRRGAWLREALSRAAAIGAVTLEMVQRIERLYPGHPVRWTPNGVDPRRWEMLPEDIERRDRVRELLSRNGRRVVGLFGDLKAKKGIPLWLEAVRDRGLLKRLSLLVVGNLDTSTARLLEDPALSPPAVRVPFVPQDELAGYYAACDLVAIPSFFDGMPNVLLEAMACGIGAIVSDAGAMRDMITDGVTGFVFRAEDRDSAGEAMVRALEADLAALGSRARELVTRDYSPQRELDALFELFGLAMS